ncbi:endonuclease domain-containing protein [Marinirhabdus gelatinilytica]|uniref:Very-short-patch-repair endonuclease n=1 Tax=Marinirhabdus gelatinilytica TaxID=1703343 RepID=A0A370QJI1_9FLAO|nr:endonuclease domain-containing protein [Marinirhabdus gelatinilytica]RDK88537.1 very-short-patch-repair endonuclease [Marinirhabdus gelatinilytica]
MKIYYNPKLKELARQHRNNSTKAEIKIWKYLKSKRMRGYDFHRQKPIDEYIVDFFCNKLKLAIECDGYSHQIAETWEKDQVKTKRRKDLGVSVLRFSDNQIWNDIDNVIRVIEDYIHNFEEKFKSINTHPEFRNTSYS